MAYASGSLSFTRYAVVGQGPSAPTEEVIEKLEEHKLYEAEGLVPDDENWGWCGGRHVLDGEFSFEANVYNDCVHVGLRIDSNKPPGDLKQAYILIEEQAASTNGFISKGAKKDAKDAAMRKLDDEKRNGRFRKSKMAPILWDIGKSTVYGPASLSVQEKLFELFDRTFGLSLIPLTSGNLALRKLEGTGKRRDYEDARPTRFVEGPQGESQPAEYPWVAKGPQAKDFFGNEFLTWLWWMSETQGGGVDTKSVGSVDVMIDKVLDLDCVFGMTGRDTLKNDGPTHMPEARHALRSGKVPRKLGLTLDGPAAYTLTLTGESLAVSSLTLPDVEEADTPRVLFEERINLLRDFGQTIDALFDEFLKVRAGGQWLTLTRDIRAWITRNVQRAAA